VENPLANPDKTLHHFNDEERTPRTWVGRKEMTWECVLKRIFIASSLTLFAAAVPSGWPVGTAAADIVAIKGYDTVAYFKEGKAIKGSPFSPSGGAI
jgi:hypothetical protein